MLEIFIQKIIQKHWHLQHWIHCNKKIDDYANINSVNSVRPLYLIIGKVCRYFEDKMETSIQFLLLQIIRKIY